MEARFACKLPWRAAQCATRRNWRNRPGANAGYTTGHAGEIKPLSRQESQAKRGTKKRATKNPATQKHDLLARCRAKFGLGCDLACPKKQPAKPPPARTQDTRPVMPVKPNRFRVREIERSGGRKSEQQKTRQRRSMICLCAVGAGYDSVRRGALRFASVQLF